jgi:hypothetical protein
MSKVILNRDGREQVALALLLLCDFKRDSTNPDNLSVIASILRLAEHLGLKPAYSDGVVGLGFLKIAEILWCFAGFDE